MVYALAPDDLVAGGLGAPLARLTAELAQQTGAEVTLDVDTNLPRLATAVEVALLRAAQGALANVRRHAAATHVQLTVAHTDGQVRLDVVDDGVGFDPADVAEAEPTLAGGAAIGGLTGGSVLGGAVLGGAAGIEGSANVIGIRSPAVDALLDKVISAQTRPELVARVRALDRVLRFGHYVVPHWYGGVHRVAYRAGPFQQPAITPRYYQPESWITSTWWATETNREALYRRMAAGKAN